MVIIVTPQGQLANRLFHAGQFIANAIDYHYRLFHLSFEEYYPDYSEQLKLSSIQKYIRFVNINNKLFKWVIRLLIWIIRHISTFNNGSFLFFCYINIPAGSWRNKVSYDLISPTFIKKTKKITFIDGWEFSNECLLKKHRDVIVDIFKPNSGFRLETDQIIARFRKEYDVIVGVHIRRGDYKNFDHGVYYYEDHLYKERMQQVVQFPVLASKNILFLLCSDEKVDTGYYDGFHTSYSQRHYIVDLLLLSACDLIIGPPSTFSMWASFYGVVPICQLMSGNQKISIDSFKVYGS